jgi:uncharacterized protein YjbI with pentapeptide repeats
MRTEKPPRAFDDVVVSGPLQAHGDNVVVIPRGSSWTPSGPCASAGTVMDRPISITVGEGAALLLKGQDSHGAPLTSLWGAATDKSRPDLYPPGGWAKTTEARAVDPKYLLKEFDSCRDCQLRRVEFRDSEEPLAGPRRGDAYERDLSGADLRDAKLRGDFLGWDFSRADLSGANLLVATFFGSRFVHTRIDGADFSDAELGNLVMDPLRFRSPPNFSDLRIDNCVQFKDMDLSRTGFSIRGIWKLPVSPPCKRPLLLGSTAALSFLPHALNYEKEHPDLANPDVVGENALLDLNRAIFVATSTDRAALAGRDLRGLTLIGARFVGFPASFVKTNFSGDHLRDTNFDGADLSGAKFNNADLAGSSFRGANLSALNDDVPGATFAGEQSDLKKANFIEADVSGASFEDANLSGAAFSRALAEDTDFNAVVAPHAAFTGAHIYGDGQAFESANDLQGADFNGAILAGNVEQTGGFNFTHADLKGATFDGAQCIGCNFTDATLDDAHFIGAYLPGADFAGVKSMSAAHLHDASLYCGDRANAECSPVGSSRDKWEWQLKLGSGEDFGPVRFVQTNLGDAPFSEVATCPDGDRPSPTDGCGGRLLPAEKHAPTIPAPCSAAGGGLCPTRTSTLLRPLTFSEFPDTGQKPTALAAVSPANVISENTGDGVYLAVSDGTIRFIHGREHVLIAGIPESFCGVLGSCGLNDVQARLADMGHVTGLAVGSDGSLYLADAEAHRVRRIERQAGQRRVGPDDEITTVAGSRNPCQVTIARECGNGGPATSAKLAGPYGVWVDPIGRIYIADGDLGIREVLADGKIVSVGADNFDVRSVVGDASGDLYAAARERGSAGAWFLLKIDLKDKKVTKVVGTGDPGYNGNGSQNGFRPGTDVQITEPSGLSIARNGNVLFADRGNGLIRAYIPRNKHVTNLAGVVSDDKPQPGFTEDGRFALETKLNDPLAVAALTNAEFVVADGGNHRIAKFGPGPR